MLFELHESELKAAIEQSKVVVPIRRSGLAGPTVG
jgi:hypothetical protein